MLNAAPVNATAVNAAPSGSVRARLAGTITASVTATGALTRLRGIRGRALAEVAVGGRLRRLRPAVASITARVDASGQIQLRTALPTAAATASASATGSLRVIHSLSASITADVTIAADLDVDPRIEQFEAAVTAQATASGALQAIKVMSGATFATATATGALGVMRPLEASILASATAAAQSVYSIVTMPKAELTASAHALGGSFVALVDTREPEYRTVSVINDAATLRPRTFQRQPGDYLPYDIDMEEWLTPFPGDGIESVEVLVTEANGQGATINDLDVSRIDFVVPQLTSPPPPAIRAKVWVQGGITGALYKITVRCTTIGDRIKEADFRLSVNEV